MIVHYCNICSPLHKAQNICSKAIYLSPSVIQFVLECYKTQEMCYKAVDTCCFVFDSIPE